MKVSKFNELIKKEEPNTIISKYMLNKINLTDKQLDKVCGLGKHHGGCSFKYKKRIS